MKPAFLLLALACTLTQAQAANRYVRPDATGNGSGTDWTNAYTSLPSKLVRGDTYYLADGTYGAYTFSDAPSGTSLIVIKKATVADHGTSTGWNNAYGDGEALFSGRGTVWTFKPGVGYYEIYGQRGDSNVAKSYGIRLYSTSSRNSAEALVAPDLGGTYNETGGNQHIYFDKIEFDWNNGTAAGSSGATRGVQWNTARSNGDIRFSNSYLHHSSGFGIYATSISSNYVIDNVFFERNGGATSSHHETLWVTGTNGFTFRNNTIKDTVNGALTGWLMLGGVSNANIYNNVFTCTTPSGCATGGNGIIATWDANQYANSNVNIFNNTFANLPTSGNPSIYFFHSGGAKDQNVVVRNNLYFTGSFGVTGASVNTNAACGGGTGCSGTNVQTGITSALFRNAAAQDYRLAAATAGGVATAFTSDKTGATRASDGVWDRGAFEYNAGSAQALMPPSNLSVTN